MTVKATGFNKTIKKIRRVSDLKGKPHRLAIEAVAAKIEEENYDYPPATAANKPPTPFYIRGTGTQLKSRNLKNSEDLESAWGREYTFKKKKISLLITNRASYATFVVGKRQAWYMALKGWPNVYVYVRRKRKDLARIYGVVLSRHL